MAVKRSGLASETAFVHGEGEVKSEEKVPPVNFHGRKRMLRLMASAGFFPDPTTTSSLIPLCA